MVVAPWSKLGTAVRVQVHSLRVSDRNAAAKTALLLILSPYGCVYVCVDSICKLLSLSDCRFMWVWAFLQTDILNLELSASV